MTSTAFALGQGAAAYGLSLLYAETGGHAVLFGLGAGALILALAIDLGIAVASARRRIS